MFWIQSHTIIQIHAYASTILQVYHYENVYECLYWLCQSIVYNTREKIWIWKYMSILDDLAIVTGPQT